MSACLSLHSPLTPVGLPLLSDEEILSGEPQTPGLCFRSLLMCLNCENKRGGGGVVVKVGKEAQSSHAGGIVFYLLNWKNISEKMCGRFLSRNAKPLLNSEASKWRTKLTLCIKISTRKVTVNYTLLGCN